MKNNKFGIVGFGRTGKALLEFLLSLDNPSVILIFDDKKLELNGLYGVPKGKDVTFVSGESGIEKLKNMDMIILSPGVNGQEERFLELKRSGVPVVSEMEFASSFVKSGIIAVTGTNGKSTTVSLIHHILTKSGIHSLLVGNIGTPMITAVNNTNKDSLTVLEVSSFQLEEIDKFKPEITMILNVTPDHLDRYSKLEDYENAKLNILKNLNSKDPVIMNYDDNFLRNRFYNSGRGDFRKIWFSAKNGDFEEGAFLKDNKVIIRLNGLLITVSLKNNPLIGSHNIENILAAFLAVALKGVSPVKMETALADFKGLPHRMEVCGEKRGVRFINDSKATNVDATVKSISGVNEKIVLILGGKDKGGDFSLIKNLIKDKIKKIILIGEAADSIIAGIGTDEAIYTRASTLDEAVRKGFEVLAGSGGSVLLAPGCASFDMFRNYEERGDVFKKAVEIFLRGIDG